MFTPLLGTFHLLAVCRPCFISSSENHIGRLAVFFSLHDFLIMFMAIMLSSAAAIQKKHLVLRTEHSILFFVCLCRSIQPWCKRCGWYPPSTDADDCSTSNTSTLCARYRWAHSTEPVESAAAGAASAHAQTGKVEKMEWKKHILSSRNIHSRVLVVDERFCFEVCLCWMFQFSGVDRRIFLWGQDKFFSAHITSLQKSNSLC